MRHVLICGRRPHAFIAVAILFFTLSAGQALAARTPAGAAPINSATDPVNWTGTVEGSVGGPTECDDDLSDPLNPIISTAVCSSFFLEATETGRIEAVVMPTVPAPDPLLAPDLNVFVFACDAPIETAPIVGGPANPQLGCLTPIPLSGSGPTPGQGNAGSDERVTFQAVAGVAYEVLTVPGFAFAPTQYNGCAAYDDPSVSTDGECVDPAPTEEPGPVPATQFLQDCGTGSAGNRHVTGGGYFSAPNDKKQHFATHVNRKDDKLKGVLNFKDETTDSRYFSEHITCAAFNDADKSVQYKGTASKKMKGQSGNWKEVRYCFTARAKDGGKQGGPVDEFVVSFFPFNATDNTCNTSPLGAETFGGPVYKGQVTYHFKGDDER